LAGPSRRERPGALIQIPKIGSKRFFPSYSSPSVLKISLQGVKFKVDASWNREWVGTEQGRFITFFLKPSCRPVGTKDNENILINTAR
jgi:hypothetical protein